MLAQAEHDVDASAMLLTTSQAAGARRGAAKSSASLRLCRPRRSRAKSIEKNCAIVLVRSLEEAVELSNRFAPEHLSIPDASLLPGIRHAGSVFVGPYSPEAAGDYAVGPESRAAHQRRGADARRAFGDGLRQGDLGAGTESDSAGGVGARDHDAGPRRGTGSACAVGGGAAASA